MTRSPHAREELGSEARVRRVRAILAAARRLSDPSDPLGQEARRLLPDVTGLSPEGVELGLARHLETEVSPVDLERLLQRAGSASHVHVVLSANVFVGVVRAVAFAAAAAPIVSVRASRRETAMPTLLSRAIDRRAEPIFELVRSLSVGEGDEVHAYGRDLTLSAIARSCPPGVRIRGHGNGFGVALVDSSLGGAWRAAASLSWDVVAFDQRGCISPRLVFVDGSVAEVERFASELASELDRRGGEVPRGRLSDEERHAGAFYARTLQAIGRAEIGSSYVIGLDLSPRSLILPPPGRHVHVVRVSSGAELKHLVGSWSSAITSVGYAGESRPRTNVSDALSLLAPGARWQPLGAMQSPPLDGPVDLRGVL